MMNSARMGRLAGGAATLLIAGATVAAAATSSARDMVRTSILKPEPAAQGFSKIGPVAKNLWPFNALDIYDAKLKEDVLYISSFNSAGHGQLIRLDYHHDRAKAWPLPAGIGSWGIIQGQDGNLYLGSYNGGKLLCFDPRTEKWIPLPQASEAFRKKEFIICDLAQAPNGDIYYGTYPGAHLVRYDPHTGKVTDLGRAADENYLRHIAVTPDGMVLCGVGTRKNRVLVYDPKTKKFRDLEPLKYQKSGDAGVPTKVLVSDHYVVQLGIKQILVYDAHSLKLVHVYPLDGSVVHFMDADHVLYLAGKTFKTLDLQTGQSKLYHQLPSNVVDSAWYLTRNGNVVGLRIQSYIYVNFKNPNAKYQVTPVDGLGQNVLWLRSAPDGQIFGGPQLGQTMFSYNPKTHELKSYNQVIDQGGEIYYGIPYRGKIYTISYIEATLAVYDPERPWNQGNSPESNPREILHIPQQQYRPVGGIHQGPGNQLYIGTQPDYGLIGGALSAFDPATGKIRVYRNLIPNEEVGAVATDDRFVYCATDPSGGGGSKAVATGSHFFVWDPVNHKIVFDHTFSTNRNFGSIAAADGHAYFVVGNKLMDYNRETNSLSTSYTFSKARWTPLESLQAAKDGTLWGILGGELAHINPSKHQVKFFDQTAGQGTFGLTIGADGTIYFGSKTDVWIYHPRNPSPPLNFGQ